MVSLLLLEACKSSPQHSIRSLHSMHSLQKILSEVSSDDLFNELSTTPTADSIWQNGLQANALREIVLDQKTAIPVRFNALWVLFRKDHDGFLSLDSGIRATVLVGALSEQLVFNDEHWGKLWEGNQLGILGTTLVECGEAALPALRGLFNDSTPRTNYRGSEEATIMAARGYRVCDFAAFFAARIKDYDLPFDYDPEVRDAQAIRMREELGIL